ncbi:MAG: hypothetical protein KF802_03160 [Bdellovibrionaceae bacterium]|nr:hypothetical protein [Pseudobdellovibrionaceae bacterium]MBX3033381.1 hypothetical protein [Pseudobdellovibrionaceae bacterium]
MKTVFSLSKLVLGAALLSAFADPAFAWELPAVANIDWKCEEGVGNLDHPAPLLRLSGTFETARSRSFTIEEKKKLRVIVFQNGAPVTLSPASYDLIWENDGRFQSILIRTKEATYEIGTTTGSALLLRMTVPGLIYGTRTKMGSC